MFCNKCDNYNPEDQTVCSFCGAALNNEQHSYRTYSPGVQPIECDCKTHPKRRETTPGNKLGVVSFVLSIASFIFIPNLIVSFSTAIAGLVTACVSRNQAKAFGERNGFATAGLITSIISLSIMVILFILIAVFAINEY